MKNATLLLLLVMAFMDVHGQIPEPPKSMISPTASSLGLYGEIPVSHFTGIPSIQIPLYDLQVENFKLPLSLSYHAAGVRPDQHPGWVGLGWSLNVGGVISRVVNDMPDDYNNAAYSYGQNAGYYYNYAVLNKSDWNQRAYLRQVAQNLSRMIKDTEPDIFSFNFSGYTGKFILTHERKWEVQCDRPIKVEFNNKYLAVPFKKEGTEAQTYGYYPSFEGFTLTTEDGVQYVFGGNTNAIEYSLDFFLQYRDEWKATSWYLTKIIYTDGQQVIFSYDRGDFVNQMYLAVHHDLGSYTEASGGIFNPQPECSSWNVSSIEASYQGKLIAPVYLRNIVTSDINISFVREETRELRYDQRIYNYQRTLWSGSSVGYPFLGFLLTNIYEDNYPQCLEKLKWYKLSDIQIRNSNGDLMRGFHLLYNDISSQRLMLKSIIELGYGLKGRTYSFEYNKPEMLPPYLSNMVDHWGYYNAKSAPLNYANYYSYREANPASLQYGILEKIKYPTGGYTKFVFEPHDYRKQLSFNRWESCEELASNKIAGGLRIKKVINSSTGKVANDVISREYFYSTDYLLNKENAKKSSGILGGQIKYSFSDYVVSAFNDRDVKRKMSMFSSQSVLPCCENSMGNHVGYTEVIEKRGDNTFVRYLYTNFDNGHMDESADAVIQVSRTPYEPYTSKDIERGHLILQEDYTAGGILKKRKSVDYERSSNNFIRAMKAGYKNICPGTAVSYDEGTTYRIYMYNYRMLKETESLYDNSTNPVTASVQYVYDNNGLLKEITKDVNNGKKRVNYKRVDNYSTDVCKDMVDKHILSPVVEESESFVANGTTQLLKRSCYNYIPLKKVTDRLFAIESIKQGIASSPLKEKYICHSFDTKGNAVYITRGEMNIVYLWGYNYRYIVAEIKNATLADVEGIIGTIDEFSRAKEPDYGKLSLLRKMLDSAQVTSFTYQPFIGITSITNSQGQSVYYQYDPLGRLIIERNDKGDVEKVYDYQYSIK